MKDDRSTDFGFQQVAWGDKARRVRGVFDSVAGNYDLMNDLMSAGAHRLWKRFTLSLTNLRPGQRALDVAGGTGDLAAGLALADLSRESRGEIAGATGNIQGALSGAKIRQRQGVAFP